MDNASLYEQMCAEEGETMVDGNDGTSGVEMEVTETGGVINSNSPIAYDIDGKCDDRP